MLPQHFTILAAPIPRVVLLDFASHGQAVNNITFIQFDYNYDGFNINQFETGYATIVGTADPSGGVQYFIAASKMVLLLLMEITRAQLSSALGAIR